jgi:hypothetical protein
MSLIRTMLSASLLWLALAPTASAVEVLPMDSAEPECASAQEGDGTVALTAPAEPVEVLIEAAEAPAGLQSAGVTGPVQRAQPQGGGDSSTPQVSKPSSRWNAFLPGMVR